MNILILNGSPKGDYSTTLYTCLYIEKKNPQHQFSQLNVGKEIKKLEKDFGPAREAIQQADVLLFSYPVYTFLAPSQLHRFIELLKKENIDLSNKVATQITTSKHFYDVTAHRYIQENCQDLGLSFIQGLSADMDDLTTQKGREEALRFFQYLEYCVEHQIYESNRIQPTVPKHAPVPKEFVKKISEPREGKIALVADLAPEDDQLSNMIQYFTKLVPYEVDVINIHDFPFRGGCISCFNCSVDGTCIYKDGFSKLLRDRIQKSKAIVLAFTIQDHSMGVLFKTYDDRQFCNGHRTVTMGMPFGYLISGNYSEEKNLQMVVDARAEVGGNFLAGVATDEFHPEIEIEAMAKRLCYAIENHYVQPSNFFGVGGMKIFRDLIWLMQGMMKADHKFYKSHQQYDFPQKKFGTMLTMYLVGGLMSNPKLKAKMGNKMNEGMIAPYKEALKK